MPETSLTQTYLNNAILSNAAYANLTTGMSSTINRGTYIDALTAKGFTETEAAAFVDTYSVKAVYNDGTGLSMTLFEDASGHKVLAIRGTDNGPDYISDAMLGTLGITAQTLSIQMKYDEWVSNGTIGSGEQITVTGHSLGGFEAMAFTANNPDAVDHTYTYDAPGLGGICGEVMRIFGFPQSLPDDKVTNIMSNDGVNLISGNGIMLGEMVKIPGSSHFIKDIRSTLEGMINRGVTLPDGSPFLPWWVSNSLNSLTDENTSLYRQLFTTAKTIQDPGILSPIVLDLDRDGVETTNVKDGAYFDHDGNGFAEQTGWAGADDYNTPQKLDRGI